MKADKKAPPRWVLDLLILALSAVFLYSLCRLGYYFYDTWKSQRYAQSLQEAVVVTTPAVTAPTAPPDTESTQPTVEDPTLPTENPIFAGAPEAVDFDALHQISTDAVAWIYCPDTTVDYVVAKSGDNDYYLHRLLDGSYAAGGTVFMDYRNSPDLSDCNTLIYGHNMRSGTMFAPLRGYSEPGFYEAHPVIFLYTPGHRYAMELIAGSEVDSFHWVYDVPLARENLHLLLEELKESSDFHSDVTVGETDRLVTLSTCSHTNGKPRYVLIGKLTEG